MAWNYHLRTLRTWQAMIARCYFPKSTGYDRYGAKGIRVCGGWRTFEGFLKSMGYRPKGTTLGRIDHSKGYSPTNCRWETPTQQQRNTRTNRYLEYEGTRLSLAEWAERKLIRPGTLTRRLRAGWTAQEALETPVRSWQPR